MWPNPPEFSFIARVILRGAWERTGGNTFAYTAKGWILDGESIEKAALPTMVGYRVVVEHP
ncbi:hypothetical protein ACOQFB_13230 [Anaeromyxobacter sp. Red801]|uniref:hypothetical protein n=1 Tax=Anaeromyxobacter sp. Red801 TaxID=3411632 RepID=UPI003BA02960